VDRIERARDGVSGLALVVFSALYYLAARRLPAGTSEPGPGFFPSILAGSLSVLGLVILSRAIGASKGHRDRGRPGVPAALGIVRPLLLAGATVAYVPAFTAFGFVPATLALATLAVVLFRGPGDEGESRSRSRSRKWIWVLVPLVTTALLYAIFAIGLGVPLPSGDVFR
jgi:putative tricarboxylic transport membrane protein